MDFDLSLYVMNIFINNFFGLQTNLYKIILSQWKWIELLILYK